MHKLSCLGFCSSLLVLFRSYLVNRKHFVQYRNYKTSLLHPEFRKDLIWVHFFLYYIIHKWFTWEHLSREIFVIFWRLQTFSEKSNIGRLRFITVCNHFLFYNFAGPSKDYADPLGIIFDSKLTFIDHINNIVSKAFFTHLFIESASNLT